MYIEPNTNIKIYSGIPLDNTYENTIYWANLSEQIGYFHGGIAKYNLARNTYQRVGKGVVNVGILADNLYDCNYLAFQNENFGNKWFYAFITGVDYINNNTTQITYEIDDMQTWYFDYELLRCFVEREHASNDAIGANLVEENLELGDYVINGEIETINSLQDLSLVLVTSSFYYYDEGSNLRWQNVELHFNNGLPTTAMYWVKPMTLQGFTEMQAIINTYNDQQTGRPDDIIGFFVIPTMFYQLDDDEPYAFGKGMDKKYGAFNGYTPRNNKLYTYPYNFLYVTNMQGNYAIYPYEYFETGTNTCLFRAYGTMTPNCEVALFPMNYKGSGNNINKDEVMALKGFPQLPTNIDTYKAWLAQNTGSLVGSAISTGISAIAMGALIGGGAGAVVGAGAGIASSIANAVGRFRDKTIQPTQSRGNDTSTVQAQIKSLNFQFMNKRIRGEFARIIDDYFTMYGYATHRVKIPNIHARQRWTYTKTVGCNIKGQCPVTAISNIKRIYDKGITFWVNPSEVGNYSLSNNTL